MSIADYPASGRMIAATQTAFGRLFEAARPPRRRGLLDFARAELVIPEGPLRGWHWRPQTQPVVARALELIDTGRWPRKAITGCVQSGKSLNFFVLPILHALFELGETVVVGGPTVDTLRNKWGSEILPAIKATRYAELLPRTGRGKTEAYSDEITFANGARLKFMSGKGGDETRSSYTTRNVAITEADKMDEAGGGSRETDPVQQIEARAESFALLERNVWLECTVSVEEGRIWQAYQAGTRTRIVSPCVHCGEYVCPDREQLKGWQQAETERQAYNLAYWECPACGEAIDDRGRRAMVAAGVAVHGDQVVARDGQVSGQVPDTFCFSFRWHAWHNLFWSTGKIAVDEWAAAKWPDEIESGRRLEQFVWARPYVPSGLAMLKVDPDELAKRPSGVRRGVVPDWAEVITQGIDVGDHWIYWVATAWRKDGSGAVFDYGKLEVPGPDPELGIYQVLTRSIARWLEEGWPADGTESGRRTVFNAWVDANYRTPIVRRAAADAGQRRYVPCIGRGQSQHHPRPNMATTSGGHTVIQTGHNYTLKKLKGSGQVEIELDSDYWKSYTIRRFNTPPGERGALELFAAEQHEHAQFIKHLTAEVEETTWDKERGREVRVWRQIRKNNHWFDAATYAAGSAHYCGVSLIEPQRATTTAPPGGGRRQPHRRPHGAPWALTSRRQFLEQGGENE